MSDPELFPMLDGAPRRVAATEDRPCADCGALDGHHACCAVGGLS